MSEAVMLEIDAFSEKMLLHYAAPNNRLVVEIMQLDAASLGDLSAGLLSQYVLVLGQYLVMLQHNDNLKNIEYMLLSKAFEHKLNAALFVRDDVKGKTEKARRAWLLQHDAELAKLDDELTVAEAHRMLMSNMFKAVEGLLNALKKEVSGRRGD